ncbi:MAG: SRPBCC domain-containing protein [Deltaproteobacteria bacterium]
MHEIRTEIDVEATPEKIWSILLNFSEYAQWNPFIRSIDGIADQGSRLKVSIQPPGSGSMTFRPTLLAVVPGRELRWRGRVLLPGIFDGEHYFQIVPLAGERVKFIQGEIFSGILVGMLKSSLDGKTKMGFIAMNKALKLLAEGKVKSGSAA